MIHLNMILKEVVSNYQFWFKLETHPSSFHKLEMTYRDAYFQINVDWGSSLNLECKKTV